MEIVVTIKTKEGTLICEDSITAENIDEFEDEWYALLDNRCDEIEDHL